MLKPLETFILYKNCLFYCMRYMEEMEDVTNFCSIQIVLIDFSYIFFRRFQNDSQIF